jgi:hypothetical protein
MSACVCACAHVRVCVHLRSCPCGYACLCERMCVRSCDSIGLHFRARVCAAALCAPSYRTAAACGIYSSARAARRRPRARLRSMRPAGCRARSAAGVTWTCRTASAPWAARWFHTSVVDAAGAIYVIGGEGTTYFADVWASTDGGVRPGLGPSGGSGGTRVGYSRGTHGYSRVLRGTKGSIVILRSTRGGTPWVPHGY